MLWDEGTWTPHDDVDQGLAKGMLKFTLEGAKLKGAWALIRMGGKAAQEGKSNWLLIKEHDEYERSATDPRVTVAQPDSVVTGRTLEEIAAQQDHVWGTDKNSEKPAPETSSKVPTKKIAAKAVDKKNISAAKKKHVPPLKENPDLRDLPTESLPDFIQPQLALQVAEPPQGKDWLHELKLDGYRIQARMDSASSKQKPNISLLTRSSLDWTRRMPQIARALVALPVESALLDGEVVALDENGITSFAKLQAAFQNGADQNKNRQDLTYYVFDLLHLNGRNLRGLPLERRKELLRTLLPDEKSGSRVRFSEHLTTHADKIFAKACELGAEGIISKRSSASYTPGRSPAWLKIKCKLQQEFVIGGFTLPSKGGVGIGALLLGYYDGGNLIYAGRTGTGFSQQLRKQLRAKLDAIRQTTPPYKVLPPGVSRGVSWVKPRYVCEVSFATWTADNLVRQAAFQGLREDKPAEEIVREKSMNTSAAAAIPAASSRPKKAKHVEPAAPFPIKLTHPEKQVDAESNLTKQALADYLWAVRENILPHIANRPLSIVRCPQGSTKPCFFQKHVSTSLPDGIESIDVRGRRSGVVEKYLTLREPIALAGLAQMGVLEIHPWGSTNDDIENPDRLIFDLDPDPAIDWKTLADSAREIRERLEKYKLICFLKSTGGKGLHVVAPVQPQHEWPAIKQFAHNIALQMERDNQKLYLTKMTKAARKGKIFIDYLRNERGATAVAPYSPRARQGAPVAMPL